MPDRPRQDRRRQGRGGPAALRRHDPRPARAAHHLGRAAHVRAQGGRPAPLTAARPARPTAPADRRRHRARRRRRPPVEDWPDELARQRERARPRAAAGAARAGRAPRRGATRAARAARVDPDAVLPDHVLARIAAAATRPTSQALGADPRGRRRSSPSRFGADDARRARRRARRPSQEADAMRFTDRPALRRRPPTPWPAPSPTPTSTTRCQDLPKLARPEVRRPRGRRRRRAAADPLPLQRRPVRRRPGPCSTRPAHLGRALAPTTSPPAPRPSCWSPTTTPTASAARAPTGSSPTAAAAVRHGEGELKVKALLVAGAVERTHRVGPPGAPRRRGRRRRRASSPRSSSAADVVGAAARRAAP